MSFNVFCFSSQFGVNLKHSNTITLDNKSYLSELGNYFVKCEQSVETMMSMFSDDSVSYSAVAKVISPETIKKCFNKKYFSELMHIVVLKYGRIKDLKLVVFQQIKGHFYAGYRCECRDNVNVMFIFDESGRILAWQFADTKD